MKANKHAAAITARLLLNLLIRFEKIMMNPPLQCAFFQNSDYTGSSRNEAFAKLYCNYSPLKFFDK